MELTIGKKLGLGFGTVLALATVLTTLLTDTPLPRDRLPRNVSGLLLRMR